MMQPRFERRTGASVATLVEQPRFRAGFDFLRLRGDAGEVSGELANWWEDFSLADDTERRRLLDEARDQDQARRAAGAPAPGPDGQYAPSADGDPARKRRRRRRKPAGSGAADAGASGEPGTTSDA